jgi:hypothetical protein
MSSIVVAARFSRSMTRICSTAALVSTRSVLRNGRVISADGLRHLAQEYRPRTPGSWE